jgi:hypothetical protein
LLVERQQRSYDRKEFAAKELRLNQELEHLRIETDPIWSLDTLRASIHDTDLDVVSKKLYEKLLQEKAAHQTGLIAYLGLDRYRGTTQPLVTRTVWWTRAVRDQNGEELRLFLADRHRWRRSDDGSAYIITNDSFDLVYWQGTGIQRDETLRIEGNDRILPLYLRQIIDATHGSIFETTLAVPIKFDRNSVEGIRTK